ncbi:hypothetical protein JYK14_08950 [Siccirubricoccus sp. KC 17139]|uniref:Uncharacterized protein n=1 Tax=Siccirubricoccus soli TaxID=2899147 RepID=A0ABT1D5L3_9PROT|nr:hypothetical protein [Siccirubricoccus soli]MCO6416295.1 hypothetical protein [Siccirubricoccus soli]MCP2682429.1 hypothetical protein [Siccirubricoccus soli]
MPVTAIWTRQDGIVMPESCLAPEAGASFEVAGCHMTLGRNSEALALLACRLAG